MRLRLLLAGVLTAAATATGAAAQIPGAVGGKVTMLPPPTGPLVLPGGPGALPRGGGPPIGLNYCDVDGPACPPPPPPGSLQPKVILGEPAPEYGFIVAIYYDGVDGKRHICTGTLLTAEIVLTAGHCGCGVSGSYTVDIRQDTRNGPENRVANVAGDPILFDQRVCRTGDLRGGRDLALVRLKSKVLMQQPLEGEPPSPRDDLIDGGHGYPPDLVWYLRNALRGRKLTAVGYGYTERGLLGARMQAEIPVMTPDCADPRFARLCAPFAEMILAEGGGTRLGRDTCGGDSGGPIFLIDNGKPRLVAVTSRSAPGVNAGAAHHCGGGGIYVLLGRRSVHAWLAANGVPMATIAPVNPRQPKP